MFSWFYTIFVPFESWPITIVTFDWCYTTHKPHCNINHFKLIFSEYWHVQTINKNNIHSFYYLFILTFKNYKYVEIDSKNVLTPYKVVYDYNIYCCTILKVLKVIYYYYCVVLYRNTNKRR